MNILLIQRVRWVGIELRPISITVESTYHYLQKFLSPIYMYSTVSKKVFSSKKKSTYKKISYSFGP